MTASVCPVHDGAAAFESLSGRERALDAFATLTNLRSQVDAGRMRLLRADAPLDSVWELFLAEAKYTLVSFLRCEHCGEDVFFGLCVRGAPIYKTVPHDDVDHWPWERTPTSVDNTAR